MDLIAPLPSVGIAVGRFEVLRNVHVSRCPETRESTSSVPLELLIDREVHAPLIVHLVVKVLLGEDIAYCSHGPDCVTRVVAALSVVVTHASSDQGYGVQYVSKFRIREEILPA